MSLADLSRWTYGDTVIGGNQMIMARMMMASDVKRMVIKMTTMLVITEEYS